MLICLFAAFLFFVVRQPAYDHQPGTVRPAKAAVLHSVPTEGSASLPLATFEHPEDRQAA